MYVQIGAAPQADFTRPLELMSECHRRVEHFLGVLRTLSLLPAGTALDASQAHALERALNYFQSGAPRHHEDEELSLFPRLRASGSAEALAALDKVAKLEAEHDAAKPHLMRVDELGRRWLTEKVLDSHDAAEFARRAEWLLNLYQRHIAVEDTEVFPLAGRVLSAEQIAEIGREMAERRRLNPGREGSRCGQRRRALQL